LSGQFSRESLGFSTNGMGIARYENDWPTLWTINKSKFSKWITNLVINIKLKTDEKAKIKWFVANIS
jgi:hypothetical protein